jgi:hypothetical protein
VVCGLLMSRTWEDFSDGANVKRKTLRCVPHLPRGLRLGRRLPGSVIIGQRRTMAPRGRRKVAGHVPTARNGPPIMLDLQPVATISDATALRKPKDTWVFHSGGRHDREWWGVRTWDPSPQGHPPLSSRNVVCVTAPSGAEFQVCT